MKKVLCAVATVMWAVTISGCGGGSNGSDTAPPTPVETPETHAFLVGNSLTAHMETWLQPVALGAFKSLKTECFAVPGTATEDLWRHPPGVNDGYGNAHYSTALPNLAPIDHLVTQPFAGRDKSIENEAEYSQKFYELARKTNPNVQAWLYAQWPGRPFTDNRSQGKGSAAQLNLAPAKTWQEGVANHLKFIEAVRAKINPNYAGKPIRIVPAGSALANLQTEMDAGQVPGLTNFWQEISADGLHLTSKGNYLVALVFYACLLQESPEGKAPLPDSGLTPTQTAVFQRIAWQTVRQYPLSGVGSR